jgi:hypothetical protein
MQSRVVRVAFRVVVTALLSMAVGGCKVDRGRYLEALYRCDIRDKNAAASCGPGWTCYGAHQVGTFDFCAPSCETSDEEHFCTPSQAALAVCDPTAANACAPGLSCVRTNVSQPTGLCLPVETCRSADDCRDPARAACFSKVLERFYDGAPISSDAMWCVQSGCNPYSACEAGFTCLKGMFLQAAAPDVCVPNCGLGGACPPAYRCASEVFGNDALGFCVPGLHGFPCQTNDHCLVGTCVDIGDGRGACAAACQADADCDPYTISGFTFHCGGGTCISFVTLLLPYQCDPQAAPSPCGAGTTCVDVGVVSGRPGEGVCTKRCATGAECSAVDGLPYGCLPLVSATEGMCGPGVAGALCASNANCVTGLECRTIGGYQFCSTPCQKNDDCHQNRWMTGDWSCLLGTCVPRQS